MAIRWDRKTRRYLNGKKVLSAANIRKRVEQYIEHERAKVTAQAARAIAGDVPLFKFFDFMAAKIREWHTYAGVIAYGGENEFGPVEWARIERKIADELAYLRTFELDVQATELTEKLASRAAMYVESTYATYENNVMAREWDAGVTMGRRVSEEDDRSCDECVEAASTYFSDLADIPEIGTLTCLTNCRCTIEYAEPFQGLGVQDLPEDVQTQLVISEGLPA